MACSKFVYDTSDDSKDIEDHARGHRSANCMQCCSFWDVEREQEPFRNKLRIRYAPRRPDEDPRISAIKALTAGKYVKLVPSDILSAELLRGYDGVYDPLDIVVKFAHRFKREEVYCKRRLIEEASKRIKILDELCNERARIFHRAARFFSEPRVTTALGSVRIVTFDGKRHHMYTMQQYEQLESSERNITLQRLLDMRIPDNVDAERPRNPPY